MTTLNNALIQQLLNFLNNRSLAYMNDVFKATSHPNTNTRIFFLKSNQPLQETNHGQSALAYLASIFGTVYHIL